MLCFLICCVCLRISNFLRELNILSPGHYIYYQKTLAYIFLIVVPVRTGEVPRFQTVIEGAHPSITCNAQGKPAPKIYWQRYGANITYDDVIKEDYFKEYFKDKITKVRGVLNFNSIRYTDGGSYSCMMHNSAGKVNLTSFVTVECKYIFVSLFT